MANVIKGGGSTPRTLPSVTTNPQSLVGAAISRLFGNTVAPNRNTATANAVNDRNLMHQAAGQFPVANNNSAIGNAVDDRNAMHVAAGQFPSAPAPQSSAINQAVADRNAMRQAALDNNINAITNRNAVYNSTPVGGPSGPSAPVTRINPEASSGIVPVGIQPALPESVLAIPDESGFGPNPVEAPAPPPPTTAGGEAGGVGSGISAEGRGGIYGNLFQNTNRRNPRSSLSITADQLRKSAASRLGL